MIKRKRFVKILTSLLAFSLIFCSLFTLSACTTYTSEREEDDKKSIYYGYSKFKNEAFIDWYFWRGHLGEDMDIVLPNTYKDAPVTALGGYVGTGAPCPFRIDFFQESDLKKELFGDVDSWSSIGCDLSTNTQDEVNAELKPYLERYYDITEFEIEDIVFNLHIGSNLQRIERIYDDAIKYFAFNKNDETEVLTVYAFSFVITVDEKNENFYSDGLGRMYYKENNRLVEYFLYHNRETFPEHSLPTE